MKKIKIAVCLLLINTLSFSKTIYVDANLSSNCTGNYSIANRNCSGSDGDAYKTIQAAINVAVAGDIIYVRAGQYNEIIVTSNSGTAGNWITIKSYNGEKVINTGQLNITNDYITVDGLEFIQPNSGPNIKSLANWVIIRNCYLHGTPGDCNLKANPATKMNHLLVENCTFQGSQDTPFFRIIWTMLFSGTMP